MSELIFITNQTAATRRETLDGKQYLVVPVVAIREGILNGEFVAAEEIAAGFGSWNGRPVVLGHPRDSDGRHASANVPGGAQIGKLYNVDFTADKLRGEMWLELEPQTEEAKEAIKRLDGGTPVEVSTAYWRDLEDTPGRFNGEYYEKVARNLKPDHLAILLNDVGACSWRDGCGAPRINAQGGDLLDNGQGGNDMQVNILSEARRPTFDGVTDAPWEKPTVSEYVSAMPEDIRPESNQVADMVAEARAWIASHTLLGDADADNERDLTFFAVVTPQGRLSDGALKAVIGGRGAQADISQSAKDSAQTEARRLLEQEFGMDEENENVEQEQNQEGDEERMAKVAMLVEDGRIDGLTEAMLADVSPELLDVLVMHLEAMDATPQQEDDEVPAEPQPDPEEPPAENAEQAPPQPCAKLAALIEKFGGEDLAHNALEDLMKKRAQERATLVEQIMANSKFTADELAGTALDTMRKFAEALVRPDYSGQGDGTPTVTNEETAVELPPLSNI